MSESSEYLPVILPYELDFDMLPLSNMAVNIGDMIRYLNPDDKLYIKDGNEYTSIGNLQEVKRKSTLNRGRRLLNSPDGRVFAMETLANRLFILKPKRVPSREERSEAAREERKRLMRIMRNKIDGYKTNRQGDIVDDLMVDDLMLDYVAPPRAPPNSSANPHPFPPPDSGGRRRRKSSNKRRKTRKTRKSRKTKRRRQ